VLSGADEVAVDAFLKNEIRFLEIPKLIQATMLRHLQQVKVKSEPNLDDILEADRWAKETAREIINKSALSALIYRVS
jgi:1-deoxy-D-xylulose-5-phosphate reductoisomerase